MSANRLAVRATNHCLTGCGIGEVLGLVLATWWGWGNAASIALAVALAFFFGYSLTMIPLLRAGTALAAALGIALAVAWGPIFFVNRALIRRGKGHALAHGAHGNAH